MIKRFVLSAMLAYVIAGSGCGIRQQTNPEIERTAIRLADTNWLAAATAHDLEHVLSFWSDDATILPPGAPAIVGKEAIRRYVSGAFATPGFSISWKTDKIELSQSGDMAYSTGTTRISSPSADGRIVTEENRGVTIWKKQGDGSWKCVLDAMVPGPATVQMQNNRVA